MNRRKVCEKVNRLAYPTLRAIRILPAEARKRLLALTPGTYTGLAARLAKEA